MLVLRASSCNQLLESRGAGKMVKMGSTSPSIANGLHYSSIKLLFVLIVINCVFVDFNNGAVLTPPYFNLAQGRNITATATCGVNVPGPELFCRLVGATGIDESSVIGGQLCSYCDPSRPDLDHRPQFAIDGTERWWQSPPLSRGSQFNKVNLTVHLGQVSLYCVHLSVCWAVC